MIKIATLIVTYNAEKWIEKCLNALINSELTTDIYVCDNSSSDKTLSMLMQYNEINLIKLKANLGFGGANNIGINYILKSQKHQYVFLINQDVYVETTTISNLLKTAINNPKYQILSPVHLDSTGKHLDNGFLYALKSNIFLENIVLGGFKNGPINIEFVNAAAWFCNVNVFLEIGGFNPTFFHYGEDVNFCHRMNYHKYQIGICTNSKIIHDRLYRPKSNFEKSKNQIILSSLIELSNPNSQNNRITMIRNDFRALLVAIYLFLFKVLLVFKISKQYKLNKTMTLEKGGCFLDNIHRDK